MVFSSVVAWLFISDSGLSTNCKQPVVGIEVGISFHTEGVRTEAVGRKAVSTAKKKLSGWGESWPRGRNFPVFPLVAIHDWTEKSQSVGELSSNEPGKQLSVGGGEEGKVLLWKYYPRGFSIRCPVALSSQSGAVLDESSSFVVVHLSSLLLLVVVVVVRDVSLSIAVVFVPSRNSLKL